MQVFDDRFQPESGVTGVPYMQIYIHTYIHKYIHIYRVSQEECARLREGVPYVKVYRYNPKHLYPKLNGYGDNGQRKVWVSRGVHVLNLARVT